MPAMTSPLLLTTLVPDALHAIVRLSFSDMHSEDANAAASAQDAATALRLTCRTLKAAVDATLEQLDIRASCSADIAQAAALFPGVQHALGRSPLRLVCGIIMGLSRLPPTTRRSSKSTFAGCSRRKHGQSDP
jgi:hypothetical protein